MGEFSRRSGAHPEPFRINPPLGPWALAGGPDVSQEFENTTRQPAMPTTPHGRKLEDVLRRVSEAYKDGRIVSGLKRRANEVLRLTASQLQDRPRLRRMTLGCLRLVPPLHRRLNAMLVASSRAAAMRFRGPADLSPAAQNVYQRLTRQHSTKGFDADRH